MPGSTDSAMSSSERYATLVLMGIYMMRMFSLFILLPVLVIYSNEYQGATIVLTGIALGIHGLTQALLQLPLGALSDFIGRKPVIIGGLVLFCIGGLIAASADSIYQVIAGRALQGAGAISSTLTAFAADLGRPQQRSKMMAFIGIGVGASFIMAMIFAIPLHTYLGLSGLFLISVVVSIVAALMVLSLPSIKRPHDNPSFVDIRSVFESSDLYRLYTGVFFLHIVMAANFMLLPNALINQLALSPAQHWMFYLPIMLVSFVFMFSMLIVGEKRGQVKKFFLASILLTCIGQIFWPWIDNQWIFVIAVLLFFVGFNYLEANLPALVTRFCDPRIKGSAMGAFSTAQFIGIFLGASTGGLVIDYFGTWYIALFTATVLLIWYFIALPMAQVASLRKHI